MDVKIVSLQDLLRYCEEIQSLIVKSFGPIGGLAMFLQNDGKVAVSTDGMEIMQRAHFTNPVLQIIVQSVTSHHNFAGDQSKQFILILTEFLRLLQVHSQNQEKALKTWQVHISQLISEIITVAIPKVFIDIVYSFGNKNTEINFSENILRVIEGFMNGKFSKKVNSILIHLVHHIFMQSTTDNFNITVQTLINHFHLISFCNSGIAIENSFVKKGFLISGNIHWNEGETSGKFIILRQTNLFNDVGNLTLQVRGESNIEHELQWTESKTKIFLQQCVDFSVRLIISVDKFSSYALCMCRKNKIALIDGVQEEEICLLEEFIGIFSVSSLLESIERHFIGEAVQFKPVQLDSNCYLHIEVNKLLKNATLLYFVICAPTPEIGKQYIQAIFNCLKLLRVSFMPHLNVEISNENVSSQHSTHNDITVPENISPLFLPVGGACEFLISRGLGKYCNELQNNTDLKFLVECLSKAVLVIPNTLYQNSFKMHNILFANLCQDVFDKLSNEVSAIDGVTGLASSAKDVFGWESLLSKYYLLERMPIQKYGHQD